MNIKEKLAIVERGIASISTHDDADSAVRIAALAKIAAMANSQADEIKAVQAEAAQAAVE